MNYGLKQYGGILTVNAENFRIIFFFLSTDEVKKERRRKEKGQCPRPGGGSKT